MVSPLAGSLAKTIYKGMKGLFLDAVLTRDGAPTGAAYDPTPGTPTSYSCKAFAAEYATGIMGNDLVSGTDMNIVILAQSLPAGFEPQSLDRIAIASQGISGVVVPAGTGGLQAVRGDPARATWQCRVQV